MKKLIKTVIIKTLPVMTGYIALGIGFGILLESKGYGLLWSLLMAVQFYICCLYNSFFNQSIRLSFKRADFSMRETYEREIPRMEATCFCVSSTSFSRPYRSLII